MMDPSAGYGVERTAAAQSRRYPRDAKSLVKCVWHQNGRK